MPNEKTKGLVMVGIVNSGRAIGADVWDYSGPTKVLVSGDVCVHVCVLGHFCVRIWNGEHHGNSVTPQLINQKTNIKSYCSYVW